MHENRILIHKLKNFENINSNFLIITLMLFGSILLSISAKVQVPFWPVPMTMQTFVIFLIGMTYSIRLSFATVAFYLFQGAIGLPVFAAGGGIAYLVGPTAGYLYGMTIAAGVIGYLAERNFNDSYFKSLISLMIATSIIFIVGVGYLGSVIGYDKALAGGLYPFLPSELFKIALAVAIIPSITKFIR